MKNEKGFTLVELIAVIVLIGIVAIIAIPEVTKYLIGSKNTTYDSYEKIMITAAKNRIIDCIANNEQCDLPTGNRSQKFLLTSLIDEGYLDNMKDPDSSNFCDDERSYVTIKATGSKEYDYIACLQCGEYHTDDSSCIKIEGNANGISCGDVVGGSTRWTNQNRVISIGCVAQTSECAQSSFVKTFNQTGKYGTIIIRDKAGNPKICDNINAYVDKSNPTCRITTSGNYIESVGWYTNTARAMISEQTDGEEESGLLTYGMGLSVKNRDYNKKNYIDVSSSGITTVLGYVKDKAGNEGLCSKEVKIGTSAPKFDLLYGYQLYPTTKGYTTSGIEEEGTSFTTTSTNPLIMFSNMTKYKGVKKVVVYLSSYIVTTTTAKLYLDDLEVTGIMQQGSSEIVFLLPSNAPSFYENISIKLGALSDKTYQIDKIELLTNEGAAWTDKDIILYVEKNDEGMPTKEYSYDNGATWTRNAYKVYTDYEEATVITRNGINMQSTPKQAVIRIDKEIPLPVLKATKKDTNEEVASSSWNRVGLNYKLSSSSTRNIPITFYYCKDTNNKCEPNIPIGENQLITSYNNETTNYYFRYKVVKESGSFSGVSSFRAAFDLTAPVCTFTNTSAYIGYDRNITLKCTDNESQMMNKELTIQSFDYDPNYITLKSVTKSGNGKTVTYSISAEGLTKGQTTLTLKANEVSDNVNNKNIVTSANVSVYGILIITLEKGSSTQTEAIGSNYIYMDSDGKFYLDPNKTKEMTPTSNHIILPEKQGNIFAGYYIGSNTKIIDSNGYIVSNINPNIFDNISSLYAKYTSTSSLRLYNAVSKSISKGNHSAVKIYTGEHQDSMDASKSNRAIYQWNATRYVNLREINDMNNVVFANYCWKIVRTTDTGGVKLLYNGIPKRTVSNDVIKYNCDDSRPGIPEKVGTVTKTYDTILGTSNVYGSTYDTRYIGNNTEFYLEDIKHFSSNYASSQVESYLSSIVNKYKYTTFRSYDFGRELYEAVQVEHPNSYIYNVIFNKYTIVESYKTISPLTFFNTSTRSSAYMYSDFTSSNKTIAISELSGNEIYSSGYTYTNGSYILNSNQITLGDLSSDTEVAKLNTHHFTCLNSNTSCTQIAYIYQVSSTELKYVLLSDGKTVSTNTEDPNNYLYGMTYSGNTHSSTIKEIIDEWYANNLLEYDSYIDDTIYCNDRSISNYGGWNPNGGDVKTAVKYNGSTNTSLYCPRESDRFSISNNKAKLTYKIGLATYPEISSVIHETYSSSIIERTPYWLMTPYSINSIYGVARYTQINGYSSTAKNVVRPAISLKAEVEYSSGSGKVDDPYIVDTDQ